MEINMPSESKAAVSDKEYHADLFRALTILLTLRGRPDLAGLLLTVEMDLRKGEREDPSKHSTRRIAWTMTL